MKELYFRQIKAGTMENFVYAVGCMETRECVLIDPAWEVEGLLESLDKDDMTLTGVLITHYHPDHCGGSMYGFSVQGLPELMASRPVPVHINEHEAEGLKKVTGLSDSDLRIQSSGDTLNVGNIPIQFLHTPGHTPGSQCFKLGNRLISGDTLFVQGCGRVDLPGGDSDEMYRTLTQKLATLPDDTILYPGHHYSPEASATMEQIKQSNHYLRVSSLDDWRRLMNG
ncbi:MAG TPA: MBL fold metallo-hydrolase [Myxococcales bacterium]|nr:MBL fold metallo-hydrolase [Myxococcales bacterium]